jgi:dihydroorotate dehydrogenase
MPDWFYQPVTRPLLFRLPVPLARRLALGFMGRLARLPLGPRLIDFLGHMRPDAKLEQSVLGISFASRVGLGPALDSTAAAWPALARFGVGFIDTGIVTLEPAGDPQAAQRRVDVEAIYVPDQPTSLGLNALLPKIAEASRLGLPLLVRLGCPNRATVEQATHEARRLVAQLSRDAQLFALATLPLAIAQKWTHQQWSDHLAAVLQAVREQPHPRPVVLIVPADVDLELARPLLALAVEAGIQGWLVDGSVADEAHGRLQGLPARAAALEMVRNLRFDWPHRLSLIASGGVHEPLDALALLDAGSDLVEVDTGLIYAGPGLPKRINEAILFDAMYQSGAGAAPIRERPAEMSWLWSLLLGVGMLLGSLLALAIAATRQVLPYDESFVCMPRDMLAGINSRLLAFMAHDRVSLAGTMVAIGVMYSGLAWFGVRGGAHWAQLAIFVSAFTGFASFFLFLGFGYLDPLHAFVTVVLLQLLLMAVHARLGEFRPAAEPALRNSRAWRAGLWGQLLLVLHGCALLAAGAIISTIGATHVFVPEDLRFMNTTAEVLEAANPRLVPLIAHDRATFGGMLLASGWVFLLAPLWGFASQARWLWGCLLAAGGSAYAAAAGVHLAVGYTDAGHLLPVLAGMVLLGAGLALSYPYLAGANSANRAAWNERGGVANVPAADEPGRPAGAGHAAGQPARFVNPA